MQKANASTPQSDELAEDRPSTSHNPPARTDAEAELTTQTTIARRPRSPPSLAFNAILGASDRLTAQSEALRNGQEEAKLKKRKSDSSDETHEWSELSGKRRKSPRRDRVPVNVWKLWREEPRGPLQWPRLVDWQPDIWEELCTLPSRPDTLLHTGSFTFAAHSLVLTRGCPFFAACLRPSHQFRESSTNTVDLTADPPLAIQALLRYLYTRNKRLIYRPQQPLFSDVERDVDVLIVADKYGCPDLRDWMTERLVCFYSSGHTPVPLPPDPPSSKTKTKTKTTDVPAGEELDIEQKRENAPWARTAPGIPRFKYRIARPRKPTPRPNKREWDARNQVGFASILRKIWDIDIDLDTNPSSNSSTTTDSTDSTTSDSTHDINPIALIPGIRDLKASILTFMTSSSSSTKNTILTWPGVRTAIIDSGELSLDLICALGNSARLGRAREEVLDQQIGDLKRELEEAEYELEDQEAEVDYLEGLTAGMEREYEEGWSEWVGLGGYGRWDEEYYAEYGYE